MPSEETDNLDSITSRINKLHEKIAKEETGTSRVRVDKDTGESTIINQAYVDDEIDKSKAVFAQIEQMKVADSAMSGAMKSVELVRDKLENGDGSRRERIALQSHLDTAKEQLKLGDASDLKGKNKKAYEDSRVKIEQQITEFEDLVSKGLDDKAESHDFLDSMKDRAAGLIIGKLTGFNPIIAQAFESYQGYKATKTDQQKEAQKNLRETRRQQIRDLEGKKTNIKAGKAEAEPRESTASTVEPSSVEPSLSTASGMEAGDDRIGELVEINQKMLDVMESTNSVTEESKVIAEKAKDIASRELVATEKELKIVQKRDRKADELRLEGNRGARFGKFKKRGIGAGLLGAGGDGEDGGGIDAIDIIAGASVTKDIYDVVRGKKGKKGKGGKKGLLGKAFQSIKKTKYGKGLALALGAIGLGGGAMALSGGSDNAGAQFDSNGIPVEGMSEGMSSKEMMLTSSLMLPSVGGLAMKKAGSLAGFASSAKSAGSGAMGLAKGAIPPLSSIGGAGGIATGAGGIGKSAMGIGKGFLKGAGTALFVTEFLGAMGESFKSVMSDMEDETITTGKTWSNGIRAFGDSFLDIIGVSGQDIATVTLDGVFAIKDSFTGFYDDAVSAGEWVANFSLTDTISSSFNSMADSVNESFGEIGKSMTEMADDFLFDFVGFDTEALGVGIDTAHQNSVDAMSGFFDFVAGADEPRSDVADSIKYGAKGALTSDSDGTDIEIEDAEKLKNVNVAILKAVVKSDNISSEDRATVQTTIDRLERKNAMIDRSYPTTSAINTAQATSVNDENRSSSGTSVHPSSPVSIVNNNQSTTSMLQSKSVPVTTGEMDSARSQTMLN